MKLKVLVDNNTYIDAYYLGEPAASYYIEDGDEKLLLDVGYSDVFMRNASAFGIELDKVNHIVISHGHDDHSKGLKYYFEKYNGDNKTIYGHPDTFREKQIDGLKICSPLLEAELRQCCQLRLTKEPVRVTNNLIFLGEIPSSNDFEKRSPIGEQLVEGEWVPDNLYDDSALVYSGKEGIYIITGCSHSGICNIIEYAKKVTGQSRVLGVIGGFHLFEVDERVRKTIAYFKNNNIKEVYPCHCTSFAVRAEIHKEIPLEEVAVGFEVEWS